jgi:antibiotic biosynthesis monooxygenase (ABM) superfamily enzyme
MDDTVHIAITRRVRKEHTREFERMLGDFASRSLTDPTARGVHLLYPPPSSDSCEYGILRSFASAADRDAFYASDFYREWIASIDHMLEGEPTFRRLDGLEAWFREPHGKMPPRWKMALLTWLAVWPVSMLVPAVLVPLLGNVLPAILRVGVIAAGIVCVLTWLAMPLLVKLARPWLHPSSAPITADPKTL